MDDLQYHNPIYKFLSFVLLVLNLVINGWPSIPKQSETYTILLTVMF